MKHVKPCLPLLAHLALMRIRGRKIRYLQFSKSFRAQRRLENRFYTVVAPFRLRSLPTSMAAPNAVLTFISQADGHHRETVTETPKLDLDLYIQNYVGRTRFDRLIFIAKTCAPLCIDALRAAVIEAKKGPDVSRYENACRYLGTVAPDDPWAQRDETWVRKTEVANTAETARLEAELRRYKNNLIKESIRMGNEDLGRHFQALGRLEDAAEAYAQMRQDFRTTRQITECSMQLTNIAIERRDWTGVISNSSKIGSIQSADDEKKLRTYVSVALGIAFLGRKDYANVAKHFLLADPAVQHNFYAHFASPNDIAIYGGLAALATMERRELQNTVLGSPKFRTFLEQEPHIRKAIGLFVNGRYVNCLSMLESTRPDYLLDMYLHEHVSALYSSIRKKCIVQYFEPFSCATIESLEAAFGLPGQSMEAELVKIVRQGSLKARIDSKEKLLVAFRPNPRLEMQTEVLDVARKYEYEAKQRLRRLSLLASGLEAVGVQHEKSSAEPLLSNYKSDEPWSENSWLVHSSAAPDGD